MTLSTTVSRTARWPWHTGPAAAALRGRDWGTEPVGPMDGWPGVLRNTIDVLLASHAQMVLFWGADFVAFYNDAYAPTLGRHHPAALGRPAREHWGALWNDLYPLLRQVRDSGETFSASDWPFAVPRQGVAHGVCFDISLSPVRQGDGSVGGVLGVVNDTTERLRALQALRHAEQAGREASEQLEMALDAGAVIGTWVWDIDPDRVRADRRLAQAFAIDAADHDALAGVGIAAQRLVERIHPDDQPQVRALIAQALQHGSDYRAEYRLRRPEGGWRWIEASGRVERDGEGRPVRFPGVLLDIDQRIQAQQAQRLAAVGRYRAESDLRQTHEQLRVAEAAGGMGVFTLDIASNQLTVSAEFCRLFGFAATPTLEADAVEALRHSEGDPISSARTRAAGSAALNVEYRIHRADTGALRWIARRAEFVCDDFGKPTLMRGVVQDVTDHKAAESTLRESEARFRALAQAVPNQVWTAGADGRLDWFNQRVYDDSGFTRERLLEEGWTAIVHPDDRARVDAEWQQALTRVAPYETEFRIRRGDGRFRWHLVRALPVAAPGRPVRWVGTNTDIDDQKAAQRALAEVNATLEKRVAESTRDRDRMWRLSTELMVVADLQGRVVAMNPAWQALLGWSEADLSGTRVTDLAHPEDLAATEAEHRRIGQGLGAPRFENRLRHRDGSWRHIAWTSTPEDGLIHAVGRDVSAEREAERALRDTEARLRQSQKMESLGQLTGGIAHDFNNLLQGITGALEVLKRRVAAGRLDDIDRFLGSASSSAHRAAALVHRLLAFSRRQSLDNKSVDVNTLVASMDDLLRRTLGERVELHITCGDGVWPATSDENQLESAILNLAINARDAMPEGGRLSISTRNVSLTERTSHEQESPEPGDYVVVAVTDTGSGMPAEVLAKAFDPFFTTKPIGQGTGLGLSMIYGFAKQSGGHVRILSEVGHGTTVELYCLRDHGAADGAPPPPHIDGAVPADLPRGAGETVLVVEDDPGVRLLVLDVLRELGYRTIDAPDGLSAVPILESPRAIELLITDVGLPGMNGRDLAEAGRRHRPGLPVLFMTGYAENATVRSEFLGAGMHMVTKPFTLDTLAGKVREILRRTAPDQSSATEVGTRRASPHISS